MITCQILLKEIDYFHSKGLDNKFLAVVIIKKYQLNHLMIK